MPSENEGALLFFYAELIEISMKFQENDLILGISHNLDWDQDSINKNIPLEELFEEQK